jgi:hypothetical protein
MAPCDVTTDGSAEPETVGLIFKPSSCMGVLDWDVSFDPFFTIPVAVDEITLLPR